MVCRGHRATWGDAASKHCGGRSPLRSSASFPGDEGTFKNKITATFVSKVYIFKKMLHCQNFTKSEKPTSS